MWWRFKPYVSVAQRRANAARQIAKMEKNGRKTAPVRIEGRTIATTFWGNAWCDNLESYSDFANRLPRGRTYVRNGSVVDLQIEPGRITALVAGSELYKIRIGIKPAAPRKWNEIKRRCAGQIGSLIELLQGRLSQGVMKIITDRNGGLFPKPAEIDLNCSCPDWADMCKHVAATLYGIGARLDEKPELLFVLRKVDHLELIEKAGDVRDLRKKATDKKTIAANQLADVFGIELDTAEPVTTSVPAPVSRSARSQRVKAAKPAARRGTAASANGRKPRQPAKSAGQLATPPKNGRRRAAKG
jgi:uncharacterized Zn finger protein